MLTRCKLSTLGTALLILGVSTSFAQSSVVECTSSETEISSDGSFIELTGECQSVNVSGDGNQITIRSIGELTLLGDGNTINLLKGGSNESSVGSLSLMGDGNVVSVSSASQIAADGDGNVVSAANIEQVSVTGDGNVINYSGAEPKHTFSGDGNVLLQK